MNLLVREHGALLRHWARLQASVTGTLPAQRSALERLEAQSIRLRGQLIVARTQILWGLGAAAPGSCDSCSSTGAAGARRVAMAAPDPSPPAWPEAHAVLCRTACTGHAHPWRDDQGRCQRTGEPCSPGEESSPQPPGHD